MSEAGAQHELPRIVEALLGTLSKLYDRERQRVKQQIIVNAQVSVEEGSTYDSWNGGVYGHSVSLALPEELYLSIVRQKESYESALAKDLNKLHNVQGEYVDRVLLEVQPAEGTDWRRMSGALLTPRRIVPDATIARLWSPKRYRVFLSHKAQVKREVGLLKARMALLGADCFVAHEDIEPTREWQGEIESALSTMEAFVALLTADFHDSDWTDQEVGFAAARGVPVIGVNLGRAPYGFIGRFQALACNWDDAPLAILRLLAQEAGMVEAFVVAVEGCSSWDRGNSLAGLLPEIRSLTGEQVGRLISAFNGNKEVAGSFGFNGAFPSTYGEGLAFHLTRVTGQTYELTAEGQLRESV